MTTLACAAGLSVIAAVLPQGAASAATSTTYSDVPATLAYDAAWAVSAKITTAPKGKFAPATTVTNQQLATFLYRSANSGKNAPACTKKPFADVAKSAAACGEITWLVKKKVLTAGSTSKFHPTTVTARQDAAVWLYRLAGATTGCPKVKSYPDSPTTSARCRAVAWIAREGLDNRATGGTFKPTSAMTRGTVATWLHRYSDVAATKLGADVSYPQCDANGTASTASRLPAGQNFGVLGVNAGVANTTNPCLAAELAWASTSTGHTAQPRVQLYVNTADPGKAAASVWPTSGTNAYGSCAGADSLACDFEYGRARATEDLRSRGATNAQAHVWWLDVEKDNSWTPDPNRNRAALEGMVAAFTSADVEGVGLYSSATHWKAIVGSTVTKASSLYALPSWLAGSSTLGQARQACGLAALTGGGKVQLTQYVDTSRSATDQTLWVDRDHSCV